MRVNIPHFSVVIPAYNAEASLDRTLGSLQRQTRSDWEAIIVDDGSRDSTLELARQWAGRDPRIQVISQDNRGASAARNAGIARARGEWMVFLDADDTLNDRYLTLMSKAAANKPAVGAVCCGYVRVSPNGKKTGFYSAPRFEIDPFLTCAARPPTCIHGFMIQRRIIEEVGAFDVQLSTNEDWDLWARIARAGTEFAVVKQRLAEYWDSNATSLTKGGRQMLRDAFVVMQRVRSRDPRVPRPISQYANGAPLGDPKLQLLAYAVWNAGSLIAKGLDGSVLLEEIEVSSGMAAAVTGMSASLLDGLMIGAQCKLEELINLWPGFESRVHAFLDAVARKLNDPGLKAKLLRALEVDLLINGAFHADVRLNYVQGVVATPRVLLHGYVPVWPAADLVVFRIPWLRPRPFRIPVVALAPITAPELRALIGQRLRGKLLSKLLVNRRTRASMMRLWSLALITRRLAGRLVQRPFGASSSHRFAPASILALVQAIESQAARPRLAARAMPSLRPIQRLEIVGIRSKVAIQRQYEIPVLMYHRIARDGLKDLAAYRVSPEALEHQLKFLRRRGFRSISLEEWSHAARHRGYIQGRPVLLTFDDAYLDFYETAWPLIARNGFSSHLFVPTGKVGGTSDWDAQYGEPAQLMSWNQLAELADDGVTFGSRLSTHSAADLLSSAQLLEEAVSSRVQLESATRQTVRTVAPPYGAIDVRTEQIMAFAGYTQMFSDRGHAAPVAQATLHTPRIPINGFDPIETFAKKLGMMHEPPELADLP
jgi:peptidoglycan/xylan/chitin deacetylase (PgdA/CDA1 family)